MLKALGSLDQPELQGYPWEGRSHDGYADSIECAINLYNREPVEAAGVWIDSQTRIMLAMQRKDGIIGGWHGDGNFARTAIMYALMKQQGVTVQPWRGDLRLGAVEEDGVLTLLLAADEPWTGRLVFDQPRHRTVMGMPADYPRINQFPEWFTVEEKGGYSVRTEGAEAREMNGKELREGLEVRLKAGEERRILVERKEEHGPVPGDLSTRIFSNGTRIAANSVREPRKKESTIAPDILKSIPLQPRQ